VEGEEGNRTFEAKDAEQLVMLQLIKEEVNLPFRACGTPDVS